MWQKSYHRINRTKVVYKFQGILLHIIVCILMWIINACLISVCQQEALKSNLLCTMEKPQIFSNNYQLIILWLYYSNFISSPTITQQDVRLSSAKLSVGTQLYIIKQGDDSHKIESRLIYEMIFSVVVAVQCWNIGQLTIYVRSWRKPKLNNSLCSMCTFSASHT